MKIRSHWGAAVSLFVLSAGSIRFAAPVSAGTISLQGVVAHPSMAPDGIHFVYQKKTPRGWRVYVSSLSGSGIRVLTTGPGDDLEPCWRPDGRWIAFSSNRGDRWALYKIRPDGTGLAPLGHSNRDVRAPQWSPRPFGLLDPHDIQSRTVVDRPKSAVDPGDLKLLQQLASENSDWEGYAGRFAVRPHARYYKLLFVEGAGDKRRIGTMRDDGTYRRFLDTGLSGAHLNPCWDRSAESIAFVVHSGAVDRVYTADYPTDSDINQGVGKLDFEIDTARFQKSIHRIGDPQTGWTQIAWVPSGIFVAAATGMKLRLLTLAGSDLHTLVIPLDAPASPWTIGWLPDARTALVTVVKGTGTTVEAIPLPDPLLNIINISDFDSLGARDRPLLAKNGFAAGGDPQKQPFHIYEETDYSNLPVFVTSDSLLHLHHLLFDYLLRTVESERMMPAVLQLFGHYLRASLDQLKPARSSEIAADERANAAYFVVAARLAAGEVETGMVKTAPIPEGDPLAADRAAWRARQDTRDRSLLAQWTAGLRQLAAAAPPSVTALADREIALVKAHSGVNESPIFGGALTGVGQPDRPLTDTRIDYTDFIPRGHYTRSEMLRRYFLVSRWLSAGPFRRDPDLTRRALLILSSTDAETLALWRRIELLVRDFVGAPDDQDLAAYQVIANRVYGHTPAPAELADGAKLKDFLAQVDALPPPRIAPARGASFRLLPQPATPDAELMQGMVYNRNAPGVGTENQPRYFALGLDVMAVLGSTRAHEILKNMKFQGSFFDFDLKETEYAHYEEQLSAIRSRLAGWTRSDWTRNIYTRTLYAMLPLLSKPRPSPWAFTATSAWTDKSLNTALATWTELKHDTMPKQPLAIEAGGEGGLTEAPLFDQPVGFVEPEPELYARLSELAAAERQALESTGFLTPVLAQRIDTFVSLLAMIENLEKKQRTAQPFSPREIEQLRFFGAFLEHLTLITDDGEQKSLSGSDMAVVADVSAAYSTQLRRLLVLEEGVGRALPIYVAVDRNGHRELTCGAIFTYYEFTHPAEDRLTDEEWRSILDSPDHPGLPDWAHSFISRIGD